MNNITLSSMLAEFSEKNSLEEKDTLKFERFTTYSLLANDYYDSFDQELVSTGDCVGVDAVAIAVNDVLVYTEEAAKKLTSGQFDVCFYFIQAKTSSSLNLGDYLKFLQTVYVFFTSSEQDQPDELKNAYQIKEHLYSKAAKFRAMPELKLTYVYTGDGKIPNKEFGTQVQALENSIRAIAYRFSNVDSRMTGGDELAKLYKECLNRTTKSLMFQRHVALPKLASATAAYLGVAKCKDYVGLLTNESGSINKGSFYDNVRDYLGGANPVNADIAKTITSEENRNLFSVLNNGVTIVAKKVVPSGDVFQISGYQIVNGCQTSHVLFNNRQHVTDDMYLTIKLIETDDVDLSSSVIKATNSQSIVMKEAFATIKPYHKRLEDFFKAMNGQGSRFFYERRPHQFDDDESVRRNEIVSAPLLIKSFVSVVLEEPHKVHFYYGQVLKDYNNESSTLLFDDEHHPGLYFVAHLIAARAKEVAIKNKLGVWSYHLALLIKRILGVRLDVQGRVTDESIKKAIADVEAGYSSAADIAIELLKGIQVQKNEHMLPEKTNQLLDSLKQKKKEEYVAKAVAKFAASEKLGNGTYRVKNFCSENGVAYFHYGPKKYSISGERHALDGVEKKECSVEIRDGQLLSVSD